MRQRRGALSLSLSLSLTQSPSLDSQFRSLLADARITTDHFKAAAIDECFHAFLADVQSRVELTITRKMPASSSTAAPTLGFQVCMKARRAEPHAASAPAISGNA
jgi:hypothetical protein